MNDPGWKVLDPGPAREARLLAAVNDRLTRRPRSLAAEWLDVLAARPVRNGAWIAVAAAIVLLTTPAALGLGAWRALEAGERGGREVHSRASTTGPLRGPYARHERTTRESAPPRKESAHPRPESPRAHRKSPPVGSIAELRPRASTAREGEAGTSVAHHR